MLVWRAFSGACPNNVLWFQPGSGKSGRLWWELYVGIF